MTGRDEGTKRQVAPQPRPNMAETVVSWRKSSYSNHESNCVEVAELDQETVGIRDSKDRNGPILTFSRSAVRAFVAGTARGEFAVE
ncbi:DUF397 domain-containing protein [Streptomyces sp. NBC_00448]|uniref:DUF397 domain-containing protein n=1 Tax=Streptomyces sp. NBC_00448 TaxID=2903652 RepID=UPI002E1EBAA0